MKWFSIVLLSLLAGCKNNVEDPVFATPETLPSLQVVVSTTTPRLGEAVKVHIRTTAEQRMVLPPLADWLHPEVEVLDEKSSTLEEPVWQRTLEANVALYAVTNVTLFAQSEVATLSEPSLSLELPFIEMQVASELAGDITETSPQLGNLDLPDFRGPEALARRRRNLLISLAVLLLITGFVAAVLWNLRNRPKPPPPPPVWHRIALREMEELQNTPAWTTPDIDAAAVGLSGILRRYIEGRFHIQAPEQTTEEFLLEVQKHAPWPAEEQTGLQAFFHATDRIKFAGDRPGIERLHALLEAASQFVQATADRRTAE